MSQEENQKRYLHVTPSGAYYATLNSHPDDARALLLQLLSSGEPILYSLEFFSELADLDTEMGKKLFDRLISRRFITLKSEPFRPSHSSMESILQQVLPCMSSTSKVVLGDDQGFCLGSSGFDHEHADALAALSADIISLHQRHHRLLNNDLQLMGQSWGLMDPVGSSLLGIWIIHIGSQVFALVIHEQPNLNQQAYVELLSALANRYLDR